MKQPIVAVLGLGKGVGVACARRFLAAKWSVLLADPDKKRLDKAADDLGDALITQHTEFHSTLGARRCLAACLEAFDGVDFVVHIPPYPEPVNSRELGEETFLKDMQQSAFAPFVMAQTFGVEMVRATEAEREAGGRASVARGLVEILGTAAKTGDRNQASLMVCQSAALGAMRAIALDYAESGLRANAILSVRPRAEKEETWLKSRTPFGRSARADEIADAALFLASEGAAFMTGQTLTLDGGRSILNGVWEAE